MIEVREEDKLTADETRQALLDMVNAYRAQNIKLTMRVAELEDKLDMMRYEFREVQDI